MKHAGVLFRKKTLFSLIALFFLVPGLKSGKYSQSTCLFRSQPAGKNFAFVLMRWLAISFCDGWGGESAMAAPAVSRIIPKHFPTLDSIYTWIHRLEREYPDLLHVEQIGRSTSLHLPLYALKLSDNASQEEDESALLFSAIHHAREPVGGLLCMRLAETLLQSYTADQDVRRFLDELEIWIVPVVNPEGYRYVFDNDLNFPWWRKNLRDNDHDGIFNPVIDGVDLNRNYDFNWEQGGEDNPSSWFYRGEQPFSEDEISAMQRLAYRENIVAGLSFHSYGEVVLYPWGNYYAAPDQELIYAVGQKLAASMTKLSGSASYGLLPLNGRVGQSSVWMYGRLRAIDFIVELGDEYFTDQRETESIIREAMRAVYYFLDRALISGVRGHVRDARTGAPLVAKIYIEGYEAHYVSPRYSEPVFGRFERWLQPGTYSLEVTASGYGRKHIPRVEVRADRLTVLDIMLRKTGESLPAGNN